MYCVCGKDMDTTSASPWIKYTVSSDWPHKIFSGV